MEDDGEWDVVSLDSALRATDKDGDPTMMMMMMMMTTTTTTATEAAAAEEEEDWCQVLDEMGSAAGAGESKGAARAAGLAARVQRAEGEPGAMRQLAARLAVQNARLRGEIERTAQAAVETRKDRRLAQRATARRENKAMRRAQAQERRLSRARPQATRANDRRPLARRV